MLNQVILVGKVMAVNKYTNIESNIIIKVDTPKGLENIIAVIIPDTLADQTVDYLVEGATVGVKAFIKADTEYVQIVADKITFINTSET